jgi:hypothetical protein
MVFSPVRPRGPESLVSGEAGGYEVTIRGPISVANAFLTAPRVCMMVQVAPVPLTAIVRPLEEQ